MFDRRHGLPSLSASPSSAGFVGLRQDGENSDDGTYEDWQFLTKSDVYFYETVQPWIVVICRVISQINLITCGVRFFAFLWADLPIIINLALSKENLASVKDVPLVEIVEHAPKVVQIAKEEVVWVEEYKSTPPVDPKSLEEDDKGNEDWRDLARRRARAALQSGVFFHGQYGSA